ncbi:2Fe-2S iron-sulfur cluster-binding protein [Roseateles amylovorans]|uniref:2Fe-2S iron-sulfur cluster-binding protein n=1 Tax=Roseateles amylovorans TaxID=2978473 RepID=A0ABY6B8P1_9BURK|nr:2Fe-2S iron-sulfur cluster-binding protein [Roseateles amylovorans]UXH80837.1 2Fe-2S iron-sulfur cluster-binding protein [Roseateles amylovorans]
MPDAASFSVELRPQGWRFEAPPDQTLLLAALDMGLRLPHSCRNGTCRACIAKLAAGTIDYRIEWPGLSREEKAEGWILPCVACARSDLVLEAPAAINLFDLPPPPAPPVIVAPRPPGST